MGKEQKFSNVQFSNRAAFDCAMNPNTGVFRLVIHGQVANHRSFDLENRLDEFLTHVAALTMMQLLSLEEFAPARESIFKDFK